MADGRFTVDIVFGVGGLVSQLSHSVVDSLLSEQTYVGCLVVRVLAISYSAEDTQSHVSLRN